MRLKMTVRWSLFFLFSCVALFILYSGYWLVRSQPILEGTLSSDNIATAVTIERDAQGVPLILSKNRASIAYALGFLHSQERYFQMDLLRRNAAGELAELVGRSALTHDRNVRVHRFRFRAKRNLQWQSATQLRILQAYTDGVNEGLTTLGQPPFEYGLLNTTPKPWQLEDGFLALYSMYLSLQGKLDERERANSLMADVLPADLYQFFTPQGGAWEAPLTPAPAYQYSLPSTSITTLLGGKAVAYTAFAQSEDRIPGSNNWAVGGALTKTGSAIVADDMHLGLDLPNIWYRASWNLPGSDRHIVGVTLPGTPIIVVGSNNSIAWAFTNSTGDWGDLVLVKRNADNTHYESANGLKPIEVIKEVINIKGQQAEVVEIQQTQWGPIIGEDYQGNAMAFRWVAHDPQGANFNALQLEQINSTQDAIALAPSLGIPAQNLVVGDIKGNIGWTIAGAIPKRVGFDGSRSVFWDSGDAYWDGYYSAAEQPKIINPPDHRLWTANARTLYTEDYKKLGDGGYALGARALQIKQGLFARNTFEEKDLLAIQLDDRALFLQRWQQHLTNLVDSLQSDSIVSKIVPKAHILKHLNGWQQRASINSVGYRLVRNYRLKFFQLALAPYVTYLQSYDSEFKSSHFTRYLEYPVWEMLTKKPEHLLNPDYKTWRELAIAALNATLESMVDSDRSLDNSTWGEQNRAKIYHPIGVALPLLNKFLAMPSDPLAGDTHMPRVQRPKFGASERLVVSPGYEKNGIFHMATGQSAHPLSPFFGYGHDDWVQGRPSPLLPQATKYTLLINPQ